MTGRSLLWPLLLIACAGPAGALERPPIHVAQTVHGDHDRRWRAAFDLRASTDSVSVRVRINLLPVRGLPRLKVDRLQPAWRTAIENVWNDRFAVSTGGDALLPIRFEVVFHASDFHHRVVVRNSAPRHDQLHWSLRSTPRSVAHEFGHMIGAYDEYRHGGTDPGNPVHDDASIMSSSAGGGQRVHARHLWLIERALAQWFGPHGHAIVAVE